jgi:hypothetical protein
VSLSVKATKMTARLLAQAMQAFLKSAGKSTEKHGKQSLKSLTKSGANIEKVEIPGDSDINSFKKTARKYNIDFSMQKDKSTDPPNWIIFFKSKNSKSMDAAFKEFSKGVLRDKPPVVPIAEEMERFKNIAKGLTPPANSAGKDVGITPATPKGGKDKGEIEI